MWILAAPIPLQVVHGFYSDQQGWSLTDSRRQPSERAVEDTLRRALHVRPGSLPFDDQPEWFLPDCRPARTAK